MFRLHRRIAGLSEVKPVYYDCCVNTCCCFTGELADELYCRFCNELRHNEDGTPRKQFEYIPMTPRFSAYFLNPVVVQAMSYRSEYVMDVDNVYDVFGGSHYQNLLHKRVVVDGVEYEHTFFSDKRDIAMGFMLDGFQVFKRVRGGSASCWPLILVNFNLDFDIRTHLAHIIPLGIIPGPKSPQDLNSFLRPFIDECKLLAIGVRVFDAVANENFDLHVYPISTHGDMQAIKHSIYLKGHNAICPCRSCEIKAVRDTDFNRSTYYVPLQQPKKPNTPSFTWDPEALPLRDEDRYSAQLAAIHAEPRIGRRKELSQKFGINGSSALCEIPSILICSSFPHEWMHLFLENHCQNLLLFWMGKYKDLDEGRENFRIPDAVWIVIGEETAASGSTIPSAFGRRTPNITTERFNFTAEDWAFWFIFLAPHILKGRFAKEKYYTHFMKLNAIMKLCIKFSLTLADIRNIRSLTVEYVQEYERLLSFIQVNFVFLKLT